MNPTVPASTGATSRELLADVRPRPAKASLHPQEGASRLRELAAEALKRVTSQKSAAIDIGIHEGRLSHKLKDGSLTLAQLEALDAPQFCAEFGKLLVEQFGPLSDPKDAARKACDEIEQLARLLRQFVEAARTKE